MPPIACTLVDWHVFDVERRAFRWVSSASDTWVYGWGFSFVYTKEAWRRNPFPPIGVGEDFTFMMALRKMAGAQVLTMAEPEPTCSHTYHPKLSISGGEQRRNSDAPVGKEVEPPSNFLPLLPRLFEADNQCLQAVGKRDRPQIQECEYSYFLVGSWSDWQTFDEMSSSGGDYQAAVPFAQGPGVIEFVVCANRDKGMMFYPCKTSGQVHGPWRCPGARWRVAFPKGSGVVVVTWHVELGKRTLRWNIADRAPPNLQLVNSVRRAAGPVQMETKTVELYEWAFLPTAMMGTVVEAKYGSPPRDSQPGVWKDVSWRVNREKNRGRTITVSNETFDGDPCPGRPKFLRVTYVPK